MSDNEKINVLYTITVCSIALVVLFGVLYFQTICNENFVRTYETPVATIMMEDMGIDVSAYTTSPQTIILQKGTPRLSYVYSGKYNDEYIIQGINQASSEKTFYPIYVNVGDTLRFSFVDYFSEYDGDPIRRLVSFSESWTYQITEITNQQVTLERTKNTSRVWK